MNHTALCENEIEKIAELERSQKALQESEEKYSTLVEDSLTGIYIDQDGKIVFANEQFAKIYEYTRLEVIGMKSQDLVHPEDRDWTGLIREKRLKGEEVPLEYEARGLTKNGRTLWIKRRNTDFQYRGRRAILGNIVDITEQKAAQEELRDFVQGVSHDLKTPIMTIQGLSSRLLKKFGGELDEKILDYLERIKTVADEMESLVADLRLFSKAGEIELSYESVPISEIIEAIRATLMDQLTAQGIALVVEADLPTLRTDRDRLHEIIQNLLENAVKYMGRGHDAKVEFGCLEEPGRFRFHVRDNGMGIAPEDHERIFERFTRLKESRQTEGTGLGLAIVKRIVEKMGGRIWVESKKGEGATFFFTLPK